MCIQLSIFYPKKMSGYLDESVIWNKIWNQSRYLTKYKIVQMQNPPYSPDLSPFNFYLDWNFISSGDIVNIKRNIIAHLETISKEEI